MFFKAQIWLVERDRDCRSTYMYWRMDWPTCNHRPTYFRTLTCCHTWEQLRTGDKRRCADNNGGRIRCSLLVTMLYMSIRTTLCSELSFSIFAHFYLKYNLNEINHVMQVAKIHHDVPPQPYYTILLNEGNEKQTTAESLFMETPLNSFLLNVNSAVSEMFSSSKNYGSNTCIEPLPSEQTLQYSNATVRINNKKKLCFILFL